jgi:hypothetical protein
MNSEPAQRHMLLRVSIGTAGMGVELLRPLLERAFSNHPPRLWMLGAFGFAVNLVQ